MKVFIISIFFIFICLEFFINISNLELKIIKPLLYYAEGYYRYDSNRSPFEHTYKGGLLYRLKEKSYSKCFNCIHSLETKYKSTKITTVNNSRQAMYSPAGDKDAIIWVGGSFSLGISVSDQDSLPNLVQARLNNSNIRLKIINYSANAYVMKQKIAILEDKLVGNNGTTRLVIIQDTNKGRRPFLNMDADLTKHFNTDPTLYEENFPNLFGLSQHNFLLSKLHFYRFAIALTLRVKFSVYEKKNQEATDPGVDHRLNFNEVINRSYYEAHSDSVSLLQNFAEKYGSRFKILLFDPMAKRCLRKNISYELIEKNNYSEIRFCQKRPPGPEFLDIHPPSHVYDWYSEIFTETIVSILS